MGDLAPPTAAASKFIQNFDNASAPRDSIPKGNVPPLGKPKTNHIDKKDGQQYINVRVQNR